MRASADVAPGRRGQAQLSSAATTGGVEHPDEQLVRPLVIGIEVEDRGRVLRGVIGLARRCGHASVRPDHREHQPVARGDRPVLVGVLRQQVTAVGSDDRCVVAACGRVLDVAQVELDRGEVEADSR